MKLKLLLSVVVALSLMLPLSAEAKKDKKHVPRGMVESMESVSCGAKQSGLTGLGSIFGSVGVEHVNSNEKLCPQYLLRTDELEYHIRPLDLKHSPLLPVGREAEFKIKKNRLLLKVPDGDKKTRAYQVVSMEPVTTQSGTESAASRSGEATAWTRSAEPRSLEKQQGDRSENPPREQP